MSLSTYWLHKAMREYIVSHGSITDHTFYSYCVYWYYYRIICGWYFKIHVWVREILLIHTCIMWWYYIQLSSVHGKLMQIYYMQSDSHLNIPFLVNNNRTYVHCHCHCLIQVVKCSSTLVMHIQCIIYYLRDFSLTYVYTFLCHMHVDGFS